MFVITVYLVKLVYNYPQSKDIIVKGKTELNGFIRERMVFGIA